MLTAPVSMMGTMPFSSEPPFIVLHNAFLPVTKVAGYTVRKIIRSERTDELDGD